MKRPERKRQGHVVDHVLWSIGASSLDNDIAHIPTGCNIRRVQRGSLPIIPGEDKILPFDAAALAQQVERPSVGADHDHASQWRDVVLK